MLVCHDEKLTACAVCCMIQIAFNIFSFSFMNLDEEIQLTPPQTSSTELLHLDS